MDLAKLAAPFPEEAVHWRVQGQPYKGRDGYAAMALAYLDARDVMDRLDEVCGPAGWQDSYTETASGRVVCTLSIRIGDEWVSKSDGAGGTQVEAEKGGISDALKRAAVKWGIGRYLYRFDSPWVPCAVREKSGKTYWKAWSESPWKFVKRVPYHVAAQEPGAPRQEAKEKPAAEPERDPVAVANAIIAALPKATTWAKLETFTGGRKFTDALDWLAIEAPVQLQRVKDAVTARRRELDPAMQAPEAAE